MGAVRPNVTTLLIKLPPSGQCDLGDSLFWPAREGGRERERERESERERDREKRGDYDMSCIYYTHTRTHRKYHLLGTRAEGGESST